MLFHQHEYLVLHLFDVLLLCLFAPLIALPLAPARARTERRSVLRMPRAAEARPGRRRGVVGRADAGASSSLAVGSAVGQYARGQRGVPLGLGPVRGVALSRRGVPRRGALVIFATSLESRLMT